MAYSIQYPIDKNTDFTGVAIGYLMDEFAYIYSQFNTGLNLLGSPTAPTVAADTNSTRIATTAFVMGQIATTPAAALADGGPSTVGTSNKFARADHTHALPPGGCFVPIGAIIMWDGNAASIASIPYGVWAICDGTNGTPDLRDRVPMGTYTVAELKAQVGSFSHTHAATTSCVNNAIGVSGTVSGTVGGTTSASQPSVSVTVNAHTLSAAEMPVHGHSVGVSGSIGNHTHTVGVPNVYGGFEGSAMVLSGPLYTTSNSNFSTSASGAQAVSISVSQSNAGSGGSHAHTASGAQSAHSHTWSGSYSANYANTVYSNVSANTNITAQTVVPPATGLYFIKRVA